MFVLASISATAATLIAAVVGFLGAVVGAGATLLGQTMNDKSQRRKARDDARNLAAATALLIQDDFLHYQATLARALDRCTWWKAAELLKPQATIADRKTVWAALPDDKTWIVAGAQGWMDYLIGNRELQGAGQTPPLGSADAKTMRETFVELERGREALSGLVGRPFAPFSKCGVLEQLENCTTYDAIAHRECP